MNFLYYSPSIFQKNRLVTVLRLRSLTRDKRTHSFLFKIMNFIVPLVLCFRVWACSLLFIEKIKKKHGKCIYCVTVVIIYFYP